MRPRAFVDVAQGIRGRRNLQPYTHVELALKLEPLLRKLAKENQKLSGGKGCQISDNLKVEALDTKKELARVAQVSHDTLSTYP